MKQTQMDGDSQKLISVPKAATILGVCVRTIWRMISDGQLSAIRFRRCTRLLASDVEKYLGN